MGGIIRVLPQEVVVLIAAGEVVQQPAACVKELAENSLDAGATAITISIQGGGLDSIRVTDNGSGIAPSDMRLAFAPHATSKLGRADDLHRVATLGFRGEALASIARVSKVTLTSRQKGSDIGMKAVNEGGEMLSAAPAACAEGTQVLVEDLFFNAPVRRDFMRKPQREALACVELAAQLILSSPQVAFRLISDGKQVYASPGDSSLESAVLSVYGVDTLKALKKVDGGEQGVLVKGLVGIGEETRGNRGHQHFFLNGRAVRGQTLSQSLEEACRTRVMIGRYPMCTLSLTLPFEAVDVNVHPNKWEVRFANEQAVREAILAAVGKAMGGEPLKSPPPLFQRKPQEDVPLVTRRNMEAQWTEETRPSALVARDAAATEASSSFFQEIKVPPAIEPEPPVQEHAAGVPRADETLEVLGKAFGTYIIAQQGERLLLIDQHALHERLLFDRMMAAVQDKAQAQTLLTPRLLELDYPSYQTFLLYQDDLKRAGFIAEDFGSRSVRLMSLPMELGETMAERSFQDALDELRAQGSMKRQSRTERIIMAACKHAVKGGEKLPEGILQTLADEMVQKGTTPSCPHGRPIVLELTRTELERRFRRIQG
jgi:DNA mismatch repair protein MutL